ncbi:alcohol dehydrogenase [Stereum hirsutum FP-91666 SS1]|uniref:alcohol dehydrogenase n=1 Tax=Stereum hirsutum (strain FP-91666) TaxID=721885 RepID=UPI000444922F|nr:alcohol dehydrogenase [Stereum hirsutum FP-91666 SS1]EIM82750.1 alcohol dehydrogenase [Stereum hirsutum FP-91666 SS1]
MNILGLPQVERNFLKMAPIVNARLLFNEHPFGDPVPGQTTVYDTTQTIDLESVVLDGGVLVKTLVLSIDVLIRGRMGGSGAKVPSTYAFSIGNPVSNYGIGVVLRSETTAFQKGDHVYGMLSFEEYAVYGQTNGLRNLENAGLPWSLYSQSSQVRRGETVFVTTAGGPVGSLVVQLAKRDGLKVIASAGSDEKCDFVRSLGADIVFNYKKESTQSILGLEGPIDIYWDNVGGEVLDLALQYANTHGRFIQCGVISMYNGPSYPGIKVLSNYADIISKQLTMHGFIVSALAPAYTVEFYRVMIPLIKEGLIQYREDVSEGLETAEQGLLDVLKGRNIAKRVIIVADD